MGSEMCIRDSADVGALCATGSDVSSAASKDGGPGAGAVGAGAASSICGHSAVVISGRTVSLRSSKAGRCVVDGGANPSPGVASAVDVAARDGEGGFEGFDIGAEVVGLRRGAVVGVASTLGRASSDAA